MYADRIKKIKQAKINKMTEEVSIKIEKNIPITGRKEKYGYVWDMELGDSIFYENPVHAELVISSVRRSGIKKGFKFAKRKQVGGGARIWRIK